MGQQILSRGVSLFVILMLSISLLASCSRDDSSDDILAVGDNVFEAETLGYTISSIDFEVKMVDSCTVTLITSEESASITGSYVFADDTWKMDSDDHLIVASDQERLDSFVIQIKDSIVSTGNGYPSRGELSILSKDPISITVRDSQDVAIRLMNDNEVVLAWDALLNIKNSPDAQIWQKKASLSCFILLQLLKETDHVLDSIFFIEGNEAELASNTHVAVSVDAFPGVEPPSECFLRLDDRSGDTKAGPGDDFFWVYLNAWNKKSSSLTMGIVSMINYLRTVEASGEVNHINTIGFPPEYGGGVFFDDLSKWETIETSPGTFEKEENSKITLNGGFSIIFTRN